MFRFLIVEDDLATLRVLTQLLELEFTPPGSEENRPQIDTASAVDQAKALIRNARKPYHAVILDFKLPRHRLGEFTEVDETLCLEVRQKMPSALVGHITSYPDDKLVQEHIQLYHTERITPNAFALSKLDDWADKLLIQLKAFLYGKPIEERLDQFFGEESPDEPAQAAHRLDLTRGKSSPTHDLADLCCDIVEHWDDLDEPLKKRIGAIFKLDTNDRPIKISLL
jgi:CheY-like chemotaxis protein